MTFAYFPPWWLAATIALAIVGAVWAEYRRSIVPLKRFQRTILSGFRGTTLLVLVLFLLRPIVTLPPAAAHDAVVPVLVDVSRSMRVADADGQSRIARASALLQFDLLPSISRSYRAELMAVGDSLAPASAGALSAHARASDLTGALDQLRERFRGQRIAGIVLLSDGADTGRTSNQARQDTGADLPPVFAVGVGGTAGLRDREVAAIASGDQRLDRTSVDLRVSATSLGFGRAPFDLHLLAGGRLVDRRRVVPSADGSPSDERFTVFPDPANATVYTAEIPTEPGEASAENNVRSVLVSPAGRKRRLLVIEGAPGFEHSFLTRAWSADPGLDVDSVVRKGKNASGAYTFSVQSASERATALAGGFPARREDLYFYDALVVANIEGDFFTRAQLTMMADFVAERGGGLLVTGGRSFAGRGLIGTPLEAVLPVELDDRRGGGVAKASIGSPDGAPNQLVVTPDGVGHPIMRLGSSGEETKKKWASLPAMASLASLGPARPGATVLAVSAPPGGAPHPVVAVQKYGQGRSMVFGGEASWRWKMMMASSDRSYELFWRQAARWLAETSPDQVSITVPSALEPGDAAAIEIDARDGVFAAAPDAIVTATVVAPDGSERPLTLRRAVETSGRFMSAFAPDRSGAYRIRAEASRGRTLLGASDRWILVGGADREFADPRLNEAWLRRIARASGGRYVRASDAARVAVWLQETARQNAESERRDLWHEPWAIAVVILLLSTEWVLRRWWGLR